MDNQKEENINVDDIIGLYIKDINDSISEQDNATLIKRLKEDPSVINELVENNLKLVMYFAAKFQNQNLPFEDLIQEGNLGLMKAISKFDPDKGYQLSTYATKWIISYIQRAIQKQSRNIKIGIQNEIDLKKYKKVEYLLAQKLKRTPTTKELAKELDITEEKIIQLQSFKEDTISFDKKINDTETEIIDGIGGKIKIGSDHIDALIQTIEEKAMEKSMREQIRNLLLNVGLNEKEKITILMRFGFFKEEYTLQQVGDYFGITREGARLIEEKALRKLRNKRETANLACYLDNEEEAIDNLRRLKAKGYNR